MTRAGALVGCHLCGAETLIQVVVSNIATDASGEVSCEVEVDARDEERLNVFWAAHQDPWAKALAAG